MQLISMQKNKDAIIYKLKYKLRDGMKEIHNNYETTTPETN